MKNIARAFNEVLIFFPYMTSVTYSNEGWEYNSPNNTGMYFPDELNTSNLKAGLDEWYNLGINKNTFTKNELDYLEGWNCIDADNQQYCFIHSENVFTYKEFIKFNEDEGEFNEIPETITKEMWEDSNLWEVATIDYSKLSDDEITDAISGYYDTIDEVKETYGDDWKQIVVECHFEREYAGY